MNHKKLDARETAFSSAMVPAWALSRPKSLVQASWDLVGAPLRMMVLPDSSAEIVHLTSLRAERFAIVLPYLHGRVLDVGAGDNMLIRLYREGINDDVRKNTDRLSSVGVDTCDWGTDCVVVEDFAALPFPDCSFDTVCFIACLNHITNRLETLTEARRVLRPGGTVLVTMIGAWIGTIGHAIWWYSEDKHRDVDPREKMGMREVEVTDLLREARLSLERSDSFCYGLNKLFIASKS